MKAATESAKVNQVTKTHWTCQTKTTRRTCLMRANAPKNQAKTKPETSTSWTHQTATNAHSQFQVKNYNRYFQYYRARRAN